jgi:hypothetical protein
MAAGKGKQLLYRVHSTLVKRCVAAYKRDNLLNLGDKDEQKD